MIEEKESMRADFEQVKSRVQTLREMEVGDVVEYPAEKWNSVRTMCTEAKFQMGKRFSTTKDWARRIVVVRREE